MPKNGYLQCVSVLFSLVLLTENRPQSLPFCINNIMYIISDCALSSQISYISQIGKSLRRLVGERSPAKGRPSPERTDTRCCEHTARKTFAPVGGDEKSLISIRIHVHRKTWRFNRSNILLVPFAVRAVNSIRLRVNCAIRLSLLRA